MNLNFFRQRQRRKLLGTMTKEDQILEELQGYFDMEADADDLYDTLRCVLSVSPVFCGYLSRGLELFPPVLRDEREYRRPLTYNAYIGAIRSLESYIPRFGIMDEDRISLLLACEIAQNILEQWSIKLTDGEKTIWTPDAVLLTSGESQICALTQELLKTFKNYRVEPLTHYNNAQRRLLLMSCLVRRNSRLLNLIMKEQNIPVLKS